MKAVLLAAALLTGPADAATLQRGGLELRLPEGWHETAPPRSADGAVTLTFGPRAGGAFRFLATVVGAREGKPVDTRALADAQGRRVLPQAVEKTVRVEELRGEHGHGHYFALTDRAPGRGEHAHLLQGAAVYGVLHVSFTLLSQPDDAATRAAALELLRRVRPVPAPR